MVLVMGEVIVLVVLFHKCLCTVSVDILEGPSPPTTSSESPDKAVQVTAVLRCTPGSYTSVYWMPESE